jgi:hypothetical protein
VIAVNGFKLARNGATIQYKFTLKNGAVEIPSGSAISFSFTPTITVPPAITCTGISRNDTGTLAAAFAAYASADCTFTRPVASNSNLTALSVNATVSPSVATFPASGSFPVVPVHSGNPTLVVTNEVTSTNAADFVDGELPGLVPSPLLDVCSLCCCCVLQPLLRCYVQAARTLHSVITAALKVITM